MGTPRPRASAIRSLSFSREAEARSTPIRGEQEEADDGVPPEELDDPQVQDAVIPEIA
jgi:hypothetical protein